MRIPERIDSTFRYILIAARRAEQLTRGARPRVDIGPSKPSRIALREVMDNLIEWDYGPPPAPPEPEVREGELEDTEAPA
jgi:DNA-directed RNA polymerase subunit omega